MTESEENTAAEETVENESHDEQEEALEGEIVDGTWVNPSIPADDPRRLPQDPQFSYTLPEGRPSFMRMIFGSFVILTEEVSDRTSAYDEDDMPRQAVEAAIHQAASQQESIDRRPMSNLRYGTIGFLSGMMDGAQGGTGRISNMTNAVAGTAGKIISPVWNSFLFAPFHEPAKHIEQAGENKVDEWIQRGRVEEVRSRALAEVSINNFVDETVVEISENEQLQSIVQEVIASQSTSLVGEILDEIRERFVSLDIFLMGKLRRALAPAPDFRDEYLSSMKERRAQYAHGDLHNSLAGTYAGPTTRFFAFLLDVLVMIIIVGVTSSFVSNALNLFGLTQTVNDFLRTGGVVSAVSLFLLTSFNILLISFYFVLSWNLIGSTVGDAIFGIRVVNKEGKRVPFLRSILRLIGGAISASVFFLGFIWALFDRRRQGWHDKFGGTFVLYDWPAQPEETFLHEQVMSELAEES